MSGMPYSIRLVLVQMAGDQESAGQIVDGCIDYNNLIW